jgi:sugar phosphate permease
MRGTVSGHKEPSAYNNDNVKQYLERDMTYQAGAAASGARASFEDDLRKVTWRLLPLLFLCYVASYLDRVNVGFAKLQMLQDLKFSDTVYGLGAGIFFLGYFVFEVPSNMILHKVGARSGSPAS